MHEPVNDDADDDRGVVVSVLAPAPPTAWVVVDDLDGAPLGATAGVRRRHGLHPNVRQRAV